jgi:hypothetical protein
VVDIKRSRGSKLLEGIWTPQSKHAPQSPQDAFVVIGNRLGGGTSRTVFEFVDKASAGTTYKLVIKTAKSQAGRLANLREKDASFAGFERIPLLFGYHPFGDWIVVERVSPFQSKPEWYEAFTKEGGLLQCQQQGFGSVFCDDFHSAQEMQPKWFQELLCAGATDLGFRNWGKRQGSGELVLLDFGG